MVREEKKPANTNTRSAAFEFANAEKTIDTTLPKGTDPEVEKIVKSILRQKNSEKFKSLFFEGDRSMYLNKGEVDDSRADAALCSMIAFRTGPDRPDLIEKVFNASALVRDKWTSRVDYRRATIQAGIDACNGIFHVSTKPIPDFIYFNDKGDTKVNAALLAETIRFQEKYFLVRDNGKQGILIFVYENGVYKLYAPEMFKSIIKSYIADYDISILKMNDVNEVYNQLITDKNYVRQSELNSDESLINFSNCLLKVTADGIHVLQHSSGIYSTIQIPCCWIGKETPTPVFDAYIQKLCNYDQKVVNLCLEIIGVCLSNVKGYRMKKSPFFYGDGNTGKSQLKALVEKLLGEGNYVGIDLQEIEARFGTGVIYGMRLAGSSDMSFVTVVELKTFKKITGGDSLFAEFKGQQGFEFTYSGMLWFCMNRLPKFGGDDGEWVYNRILPIHCVNVIPPEEQDKCLLDKMYAERDGIVYKAIKGGCSSHQIRCIDIENVLLFEIRRISAYVREHEDEFIQLVSRKSQQETERQLKDVRKEYDAAKERISKLDTLIENLYEDKVGGVITAERFQKLSQGYEAEQEKLKGRVVELKKYIDSERDNANNIGTFVSIVKRYTEIPELSAEIIREFIEKIVVYQPTRIEGRKVQKLRIYYKCIGAVDIPMEIEEKKTA